MRPTRVFTSFWRREMRCTLHFTSATRLRGLKCLTLPYNTLTWYTRRFLWLLARLAKGSINKIISPSLFAFLQPQSHLQETLQTQQWIGGLVPPHPLGSTSACLSLFSILSISLSSLSHTWCKDSRWYPHKGRWGTWVCNPSRAVANLSSSQHLSVFTLTSHFLLLTFSLLLPSLWEKALSKLSSFSPNTRRALRLKEPVSILQLHGCYRYQPPSC